MRLEEQIPNFELLYEDYQNIYKELENFIIEHDNLQDLPKLSDIRNKFNYCDVKLRMAFAISRIDLNHKFMQKKIRDLKICHLMLYKFADLWFAYEAFFDLYELINSHSIQSKIVWLSNKEHFDYKNIDELTEALTRANHKINTYFNTNDKRRSLIEYLKYCERKSSKGQKSRIPKIVNRLSPNNNIPQLSEKEFLTIGYSIRNNFVHNGETTVTTPELNYSDKKNLLITLYEFVTILNLVITKKLMQDFYT